MTNKKSNPFHVARIGASFPGTLLAYQLIINAQHSFALQFLRNKKTLRKAFYSGYMLNVSIHTISALPDQPEHFLNWLVRGKCQ
ncbi:hypothetical protein PHSC3_001710 [Chlamydiales bacterium STE3]|nr:hypothetical protein PHSC3_001710 [Chlamydiales bacterium STE3]